MKIMIIEDEGITRQWLHKKIEELGPEYDVAGIFSNGRQALAFLEAGEQTDVIFTDIRMPVMDGLEFLEKIGKMGLEPYKVILSSYDEFQYARRAMKLGAHEFVLKPEITKDTLKQILDDARKKLEMAQPKSGPAKQKSAEEERGMLLLRLLEDNGSPETSITAHSEKEKLLKEKLSEIFGEHCAKTDLTQLVLADFYLEKEADKEKLSELISLFLEQEHLPGAFYLTGSQEFLLACLPPKTANHTESMDRLVRILQVHLGVCVYTGVSRMQGEGKILEMHRHATVAKENRIFFGIPGCQQYDDMRIGEPCHDGKFYFSNDIRDIKEYLSKENYMAAIDRATLFLASASKAHYLPPAYVKALCNEILSAFLHEIWKYPLTEDEKSHVVDMNLLPGHAAAHFEQLDSLMKKEMDYFLAFLQRKKNLHQYSAPVREALAYVENHFGERISLEQVADAVYLSRPYLSTLFKKETGKKFSSYLQEVRLAKSCPMLKDTSMSIGEVAEKAGFFDAAHFSRVFKEKYGCTPIDYRKAKA